MASFHIIFAVLLKVLIACASEEEEATAVKNETVLLKPPTDDVVVKDFHLAGKDWIDMFLGPNGTFFPSTSATMMAHVSNSNKNRTAEEQLEDIKSMAIKIGEAIKNEMANLLTFAIVAPDPKDPKEDNNLRKRRSVNDPMDSTKLVMRLLNHMKSNNDHQTLALEKMMSAQEIAEKYGIEFTPDTDILSDLAIAATNHASELTTLLKDACKPKKEEIDFVSDQGVRHDNLTETIYVFVPEEPFCTMPRRPEVLTTPHHHHICHSHERPPCQPRSPAQYNPVTPRPTYHDALSYPSNQQTLCPDLKQSLVESDFEVEPELVGEEIEEIISSKVYVDHESADESTVNHVMTYTVAEKSHFKKPEIEKLPEQLQYSFFLI